MILHFLFFILTIYTLTQPLPLILSYVVEYPREFLFRRCFLSAEVLLEKRMYFGGLRHCDKIGHNIYFLSLADGACIQNSRTIFEYLNNRLLLKGFFFLYIQRFTSIESVILFLFLYQNILFKLDCLSLKGVGRFNLET